MNEQKFLLVTSYLRFSSMNQSKCMFNSTHDILCFVHSQGGSFQTAQSFEGTMSRVNVWSFAQSGEQIKEMYRGCGAWNGDAVAWYNFRKNFYGNMEVVTPSSCSLAGGNEICVIVLQSDYFFHFFLNNILTVNQQRPRLYGSLWTMIAKIRGKASIIRHLEGSRLVSKHGGKNSI